MALPGITTAVITAAQAGDQDAMWRIVSAHDPIIRSIIRQVAPGANREDVEDLLQDGRAELIMSLRRYDADTPSAAQVQTYAYAHIRRAIVESHIRATTGMAVDPTTLLRVRKALADFDGNEEAAALAVYARHGISRTTFTAAREADGQMVALDSTVQPGRTAGSGSLALADIIPDPSADVADPTERRQLAHHLMSVIAPRQSLALRALHGVGMMPIPDDESAAALQVTRARLRMLRSDGIKSARAYAFEHAIAA